ncbi:hypothetical protein OOU_Y34scaffold01044g2 [Pyricularia oryzae Y34]|uniref:Uncharacterized protein n=2 Tax=Pyricularia oryzae TaxID=318829 RepID=A0AA97PFJ8_PYRO3|nr:hypothetical protein OOU_Y34scaffold01044g2 [Pyricularia oryzae Y34]
MRAKSADGLLLWARNNCEIYKVDEPHKLIGFHSGYSANQKLYREAAEGSCPIGKSAKHVEIGARGNGC